MKKILPFIILCSIINAAILIGQEKNIRFNHFDIEQGLSQNVVTDMLQDSRGFMWFATYNGLNRYDGYNFKIYKTVQRDPSSLRSNKINTLCEDHNGALWIGTFGGGLSRFNKKQDCFTTYMHDPNNPFSLADNKIITLYEDSKNRLWIGTKNCGLSLLFTNDSQAEDAAKDTLEFNNFSSDKNDSLCISNNGVMKIYEDSNGDVWFTTFDGLLNKLINGDGGVDDYKFKTFDPGLEYGPNSLYITIDQVIEDRNYPGLLWLASSFAGLLWFDSKNETFLYKYPYCKLPDGVPFDDVWSICWEKDNEIWLGTFGGAVYSFILNKNDDSVENIETYQFPVTNPNITDAPDIRNILEDRSGMLWFGANPNGLYTLEKRVRKFKSIVHDPSDKRSLVNDFVLSTLETKDRNLWIGTGSGLDVFNSERNKIFSFKNDANIDESIGSNTAYSLYQDEQGEIWIGTRTGLEKFIPATNSFKHYSHDPSDHNSLSHGEVIKLFSDSKGILWIGTWNGGLNKLVTGKKGEPDKFLHYTFDENYEFSISGNRIMSIAEDKSGNLWIGTAEGGLNRMISDYLENSDGSIIPPKFKRYHNEPANPNSLSNNDVRTIYVDDNNDLLVGTFGGGLNKIVRDNLGEPDEFIHYTEKDGLSNDVVRGILADDKGFLWISTASGLSRFNPATNSFLNFATTDGLQTAKFEDAYYKSKIDGRFYFGGVGGVVEFQPGEIKINDEKPNVIITSFKRYNEEGDLVIDNGISEKEEIFLTYMDKIIIFEFAALSFTNSSKNKYEYILEGYGNNWIELGTKREVTFTNLDPGSYVLKVKGSNADGIWNDEPAMLKIFISPPWWSTFWAYGFYVLFVLSLLYGIRRYELKRREEKEEKRILKLENDRKTKELEQARKLQLSMLPKELPSIANLDIAVYIKTATEVGGDYYDFHQSDNAGLTALIGDATGHGLNAGMLVSVTKGLFQNLASQSKLENIISQLNSSIFSMNLQPMYMSLSLIRILDNGFQFVGAGMPPFLFYKCESKIVTEIESSGPPLGGFQGFNYKVCNYNLSRGDIIILMSDGFAERRNASKEIFGWETGKKLLSDVCHLNSEEIIKEFVNASDEWGGERPLDDDITFMVIKIR